MSMKFEQTIAIKLERPNVELALGVAGAAYGVQLMRYAAVARSKF